jgi:hypothetical protein
MLSKRGDATAAISVGSAGTNLHAAVAVSDHVAILASGHYANNSIAGKWRYRSHRAAELGVGYFQKKNKMYFEVFGGVGLGKGYARDSTFEFFFDSSVPKIFSGEYVRYFLQPSIGRGGHVVEGAITTRFSVLSFSSLNYSRNDIEENVSGRARVFLEPAFTFRVYPGGGQMFISTQVGTCLFLNERFEEGSEYNDPFEYSAFQMSVGVGVKFGKKPKASAEQ